MRSSTLRRGLLLCAAPVLLGLWVAATTLDRGGQALPWRPTMVDLEVYRRAGEVLLAGGDLYSSPGALPFLYPPFAAVLAVPLAVVPAAVAQIGWTVAGILALLAVLRRYGLRGTELSAAAVGCVLVVEPVAETLGYGQVGIVLVALVVLDLAPGPRLLRRRRLPEGVLTGVAAAVKLTPAVFVIYLLVVGRTRAAATATATFLLVTLGSAVVARDASADFWSRLGHGETGLGSAVTYYTNQSVLADTVRAGGPDGAGLLLAALVAVLGVYAAARWHRAGDEPLGIALCGVASLLASPIAWVHHFVWVVPLAVTLLARCRPGGPPLPRAFVACAWSFVAWVAAAPVRLLPHGGGTELTWNWAQHLLASVTALLGVAVLLVAAYVRPAGHPHVAVVSSACRRHRRATGLAHRLGGDVMRGSSGEESPLQG